MDETSACLRHSERAAAIHCAVARTGGVRSAHRLFRTGPGSLIARMPFRFVHAADLHLDSPLRSLAMRDPDLAGLVGNATRQVLARIIDLCLDEQVDALLIAGDLYDGDQTSMKTARFLAEQLRRLDEAGIRTFVIRGNHDALSRITRELTLPPSVKLFGGRAEAVAIPTGSLEIAVHGMSFAQTQAPESLLPKFRPPVADAVNVGILHTSLGGAKGHSPYAPCAPADLHGSGFDYWALGHIHVRSVPRGAGRAATVVMPGMPQGRDIGEAGPKSVTLVTVADDRGVTHDDHLTSVAQFERVAVDLGGVEEWRGALAAVEAALGARRDATRSEHLVARVEIVGTTPLAWRLRRDADVLLEDLRVRAQALGRTWLDTVALRVEAPEAPAGPAGSADPLVELRRLIHDDVLASAEFRSTLGEIVADLSKKLPGECRDAVFGAGGEAAAVLARLAAEGAEDVLARLRDPAGAEAP